MGTMVELSGRGSRKTGLNVNSKRKQLIEQNEISEIYTFSLGGIPQKVLIEGKRKELPVVITLHGGPGSPAPFSVGCRGLFPMFTNRFMMVYWDQLGCGINNYKLNDAFCVDDFVEMTADLIAEVKKLFPDNRIVLLGMSWGSILALKSLRKAKADVDAVVVWGQVFRNLFLNEEVYKALEHAGVSAGKMRRIRAISAECFRDGDMKLLAGSIRKYTDGYFNKKGEHSPIGSMIRGLFTSPDYRLKDIKAVAVNGTATSTRLWPELLKMDLTEELLQVSIPYYILQGDTDIVTSTESIGRAIALSGNPNLHCQIIANSGHIPGKEGIDAVFETLSGITGQDRG